MKKIIFAMAVLFGCAMESNAQTNFIATLQHEGEFTHYYGAGALTEAYNAADTNDIITGQSEKPVENILVFAKEFVPLHP